MKRMIFFAIVLLLTSFVWGLSLPAQSKGNEYVAANGFNALSSLIGAAALLVPIAVIRIRRRTRGGSAAASAGRGLLLRGVICGVVMTAASLLQQWGLVYASAGKAGFLSSLYVVAVPLLGSIFRRRTSPGLWAATALSVFGTWLLCRPTGGAGLNPGDWCLLASAACFAIHILLIDRWSELESLPFCALQLLTTGILSFAAALICRDPLTWSGISKALPLLLYCGVLSIGGGYTVQIYTQKFLHPTVASIILSTESFFAVLGGWFFLNEKLTSTELIGGGVIFAATILAQFFRSGAKALPAPTGNDPHQGKDIA